MSDDDVESPDEKFSSFLPALTADDQVINAALMRLDMVNLLADMVSRSAKRVQEEIATDLGYGSAEPPRIGGSPFQIVHKVPVPLQVGKKRGGAGSAEVIPSIQDSENLERRRWGLRPKQICEPAGASAGVSDPSRCIGLADRL